MKLPYFRRQLKTLILYMQKILLVAACALFIFLSCSKGAPRTYTITADIDGVTESFNTNIVVSNGGNLGIYEITAKGFQNNSSSANGMLLTLDDANPISTGTYILSTAFSTKAAGVYYIQPINIEYGGYTSASGADVTTITVTSIDSASMQGTFSGQLLLATGNSAVAKRTVTNGKFNIALQ